MSSQFTTPVVTEMQVIPVAGHDSMLMNLSGAHAPFFTRNIVIIKDNSGHTGVGEIPGGEKIRKTLEDTIPLVVGKTLGEYKNVLTLVPGEPLSMHRISNRLGWLIAFSKAAACSALACNCASSVIVI